MPDPTEKDWCSAACADALVEGLTLQALQALDEYRKLQKEKQDA
jgi:hypothetical protein